MTPAFLSYGLLSVIAFIAWSKRNYLSFAILCVPLIYCGYFIFSILIFSFGTEMPFTYYAADKEAVYSWVCALVCLHFIMVAAAHFSASLFDRRKYTRETTSRVQQFSVGWVGAAFCFLPAFFVVLAVPASELWLRSSFVFDSDRGAWMRFADLLLFLSAVLTPFIRSTPLKFIALAAVTLAFLAIGSRSAIIMMVIFVVLELFVVRRHGRWLPICIFLTALWLLSAILYLRWINTGGVMAVFNASTGTDLSVLMTALLFALNYFVNLSFILIGELLVTVEQEARWFYYSIIPLPSAVYDQSAGYDAANRFRQNIPFSGFGYAIGYLGWPIYAAIVYGSALLFFYLRSVFSPRRDILEAILCFALLVFPFFILLQYNLRTGSRLIYAFALFYFLIAIGRRVTFRRLA